MDRKKIFITGGSGFIGKNLIEFFSSRYEILAPTHQELDLLDESAVASFIEGYKPHIVIHCANIGATRKTDKLSIIVDHNVRMFLNLARQEKNFGRMIFYGSGSEFDKRLPISQVADGFVSPNLPATQYGFSKYLCSHFVNHFEKLVNLRIFGIYGKYDDYENRFVSNAICRAVKNLPIVIYRDQLMNFIWVEDLGRITEQLIEFRPKQKFYNVSNGRPIKLSEMAETIKKISGKNIEIKIQHQDMAPEYTCEGSSLKTELPNFKPVDLDKSLKDVYDWYSFNEELIDVNRLPI